MSEFTFAATNRDGQISGLNSFPGWRSWRFGGQKRLLPLVTPQDVFYF
jgi:hypothetical protein